MPLQWKTASPSNVSPKPPQRTFKLPAWDRYVTNTPPPLPPPPLLLLLPSSLLPAAAAGFDEGASGRRMNSKTSSPNRLVVDSCDWEVQPSQILDSRPHPHDTHSHRRSNQVKPGPPLTCPP
jgi:hypothetical protein